MKCCADGPRITCTPRRGQVDDVNVNLKCEIDANPRVIALFWVLDDNGTTLAEGEVIDEAWTLVMVPTHYHLQLFATCPLYFPFISRRHLGDIAEKRFSQLRHMLPFRGLFVCLSVTFAHCAQTAGDIDTIYFAYDSTMRLPDPAEIWLTSLKLFLPNFVKK